MKLAMLLSLACAAALAQNKEPNPHEGQEKIDPARMFTYQLQDYEVRDFASDGWILDIGGGGEGIIGRLKGSQVVAIDLYAWGMKRTPPGPLKVVMDATDLKFLDGSFGTVTSFFTLMYMKPEQQRKAMDEAFRVLQPGGRMRIWDTQIPVSPNPKQDLVIYKFRFQVGGENIETGYGTFFPQSPMDLPYYESIAKSAGFVVEERAAEGNTFRLVLRKS
jgi:SAM-dependent methyltransferase